MELLGDMGHVESHFRPFGDSVSVGARWVLGLRQTYHRLINHFGRTRWVTRLKWKLDSVCLEIVLILSKIGARFPPNMSKAWKFFWTHPKEVLGDVGHVESRFSPFWRQFYC